MVIDPLISIWISLSVASGLFHHLLIYLKDLSFHLYYVAIYGNYISQFNIHPALQSWAIPKNYKNPYIFCLFLCLNVMWHTTNYEMIVL